jgi:SAM-dependent methyltransferase
MLTMTLRQIARKVLPVSVHNAIKRALGMPVYEPVQVGQKESDYYDRTFDEDDYWRRHYTRSEDYACWTVIVDRLRSLKGKRLLEIGCGSGQLAAAIRDARIVEAYCGFDFSANRLAHAKSICPEFRFEVADAFATDLYETFDYDSALSTEFLEHVKGDLEVLGKLRPGTAFVGIVPNVPWVSHVRYFKDCEEVTARYGNLFDNFDVIPILLDSKGKTNFLFQGFRNRRSPAVGH